MRLFWRGRPAATLARMATEKWIAKLPARVRPPFRVFINGVEQHEGDDYTVGRNALVFNRPLAQEGKLGFWRWLIMFLGIAGTYRKHETVDVQYTVNGKPMVATGLKIERLDKSAS
jgi:hypothetical protein